MRAQQPARQTEGQTRPTPRGNVRRPSPAPAPRPGGPDSPMSPAAVRALQRSAGNAAVSRMLEELRAADGPGAPGERPAPAVQRASVPEVLNTPGRPLDPAVRARLEPRMGADFSGVRVHEGAAARASAAEVGARAYTSGHHIVIGAGGSDEHTLAHELTHVIQQSRGPVAGTDNGSGLKISDPADRFEREAEANAHRVLADHAPLQRITGRPLAPLVAVQRMTEEEFEELMDERDLDALSDIEMEDEFAFREALRYAPEGTQAETPEADKPMDSRSRLSRANQRSEKRGVPSKESLVGTKSQTPFGRVSLNSGYAGDLGTVVKSKKDDFPGTEGKEWERYAHLLPRLSPEQRVALADTIKSGAVADSAKPLFTGSGNIQASRAAAVIYGVSRNSEELRYPGAAKALRAALRMDGGNYTPEQFAENFPMAKPGGAGAFRGDAELGEGASHTLTQMSESSSEEEK